MEVQKEGFWSEDLERIGQELRIVRGEMSNLKKSLEELKGKGGEIKRGKRTIWDERGGRGRDTQLEEGVDNEVRDPRRSYVEMAARPRRQTGETPRVDRVRKKESRKKQRG